MTPEVQAIVDKVAEVKSVDGSAVTLINEIAATLAQHADDPVALKAALDDLTASNSDLAAAVAANTPAAP